MSFNLKTIYALLHVYVYRRVECTSRGNQAVILWSWIATGLIPLKQIFAGTSSVIRDILDIVVNSASFRSIRAMRPRATRCLARLLRPWLLSLISNKKHTLKNFKATNRTYNLWNASFHLILILPFAQLVHLMVMTMHVAGKWKLGVSSDQSQR